MAVAVHVTLVAVDATHRPVVDGYPTLPKGCRRNIHGAPVVGDGVPQHESAAVDEVEENGAAVAESEKPAEIGRAHV